MKFIAITRWACALLLGAGTLASATGHAHGRGIAAKSTVADAAATALFVNSNLDSARGLAATALRSNARDADALFVDMEAAALEADTGGELEAALRLCEATQGSNDPRASVAAARILDLAGNTLLFRGAIPRIQKLIAAGHPQANYLHAALLAAAADGAPGLSELALARQAGLITDWQMAGPFGAYPNLAFDSSFAPEHDDGLRAEYDGRRSEQFRFEDGNVALPGYFPGTGVFYAASEAATAAGDFYLRLESSGTAEVFVDGVSVLRKDDRFRATPDILWTSLHLNAGKHRVLVKFLPGGAPFRVAVLPVRTLPETAAAPVAEPEAAYLRAAQKYWAGDYDAAITLLTELRQSQESAPGDFLLAQAWKHSADEVPEEAALLESTLKQAPQASAAEYELAANALQNNHLEEAYSRLRRVLRDRPGYAPAQALRAQAAARLQWDSETGAALEAELRLAPACDTIARAARFFTSISAYGRARQLQAQLNGCAPGSLAYARALSEAGDHAAAAAAAGKVVDARPLDRSAREFLVGELARAGRYEEARAAVQPLMALAPNSAAFRELAAKLNEAPVLDQPTLRGRDFVTADFYAPYRRDGLEVIRKAAARHFSGGPAVFVLDDRVVRLEASGSMSVYVHRITRLLNRGGIEKYGEVSLPEAAEVLELRTIRQDGTLAEPELGGHSSTISMPALAPGDAIEQEYVLHYPAGAAQHADEFAYTFGSFDAPILYARFVVLSPTSPDNLRVMGLNGTPAPVTKQDGNEMARIWERENFAQSERETAAPKTDILPTVRVLADAGSGWKQLRDADADAVIDAVRAGPRVQAAVLEARGETDDETAHNLYRLVTSRLQPAACAFNPGELETADNALADYSGCRTVTLLALARAAGLDAQLLLARTLDQPRPTAPDPEAYTHPLLLFRLGTPGETHEIAVDAEDDGLGFGVLPATIAHEEALAVPLTTTAGPALRPVPASAGDEHSVADADVSFDALGNLTARLTIRMGAARSAEMRNLLRGIAPARRARFFEQLASRIFPGATGVSGEAVHEDDPQHPLEVRVICRAPRFLTLASATVDMDQLAPALGLRKMYGLGTRHFPLYVDTPLIETTIFHVHLPPGFRAQGQLPELHTDSPFGAYTLEVKLAEGSELEIRRAFSIPVQLIAADAFEQFARFSRQVEEGERQRITLVRTKAERADLRAASPSR